MLDQASRQFRDRADAGRQLAAMLAERGWTRPIILGIPRGGVAVAVEVARSLGDELAVLAVRRLEAPYQPQLTIGAVAADGITYVNEALAQEVGATVSYLRAEEARKRRAARRLAKEFEAHRCPALGGRTAVVVDDGLVTGATATAAVRSARSAGAAWIVVAVPAGPPKVLERLRLEADEVICVAEAPDFVAVDRLYGDFHHVGRAELDEALGAFTARRERNAGKTRRLATFSAAAGLIVPPRVRP